MSIKAVTPEDIFADNINYTQARGVEVRKGTVAAFIANINIFEDDSSSAEDKTQAIHMIMELAPAIVALGFPQHITFKNSLIESIIQETKAQFE
ncbi:MULTISPECIES: hypothetical protein [unclassified Legionella]|uniref:hypothetical protein n=1 Tax=unclassified Legionella TaxID=2622702 RepID=UPI00105475A1|nr:MULTISPECIES: hypothetical protein [unclassified Legionella]MDI9818332.1 hypothetical protein [Legionella sp. PL877]